MGVLGVILIFAFAVTMVKRKTNEQENTESQEVLVEVVGEYQEEVDIEPEPEMLAVKSEENYFYW